MDDFLYALKVELEHLGGMPEEEITHQVQMYENYINEHTASGEPLEKVLRRLGDPSIIASMIQRAYNKNRNTMDFERAYQREQEQKVDFDDPDSINSNIQNPDKGIKAEFTPDKGWDVRLGGMKLNSWYGTLIIVGIVLVIFYLIKAFV